MIPVFYHWKAKQDFDDAALYYEQQCVGLGDAFEIVILETEELLSRNPKIGVEFAYGSLNLRKYSLPRFPYTLYYSDETDRIYVYAIAHDSRKPGYWVDRIE